MYNNGGTITVDPGATLIIEGNYTSASSGVIEIDGNVQLKGDFINTSGTIAPGSTGTLTFNGTAAQQVGGVTSTNFYCSVVVNNTSGVSLNGADEVLYNALTLTNGKLTLNAYDLTMAAVGITATSSNYIVTNNTAGELKGVVAASAVTFPVGTSTAYNPVILDNTGGTSDTYSVVYTGALPGGWTGGTGHAVNGNWEVSEGTPGGSNLTVTPQWNLTDEQAGFARTDCAVGVSTDAGATVAWKASGAAIGANPYTRSGAGFTSVGTFLVGDYFFEGIDLDLDIFLAGPYSAGTMSTALLAASQIPLNDPYGNSAFAASIPANVVDWIEVEIRSAPGTTVKSYSFFVDNNGNVLNTDGSVVTKLTGLTKASYYVAVRHRNHLGAMTASAVDFTAAGPFAFNFGTAAPASIYGTNAMRNIGGTYALWAGDTDGNGTVQFTTGTSDITPISNAVLTDAGNPTFDPTFVGAAVYSLADADMNATVQFTTGNSDITPVSASVLNNPANGSADPTLVLTQQLP